MNDEDVKNNTDEVDEDGTVQSEMDGGDPEEVEVDKEPEYVPQHVLDGGRDYRVEGNDVSGYLGVDPEYMTYANPGEKAILTDSEKWDYTNQYDHLEGNADEQDDADTAESDRVDEERVREEDSGDNGGDAVPVRRPEEPAVAVIEPQPVATTPARDQDETPFFGTNH